MDNLVSKKRWHITICLKTRKGSLSYEKDIEELGELDDIIENGPSFNTISLIDVTPNSANVAYLEDTLYT